MSIYKKILFTGSTGRFGKVFKKINNSNKFIYPTSKQLDIINQSSILNFFKKNKIDLVIHCAALSRPMNIHIEKPIESISTNIIGTANLVNECIKRNIKIIYFSTNYVYPGLKGNYNEKSSLNPINNYAWSKLGGECAVKVYEKSLILRICMTEKPFIHKKAFKNMNTNFIFHEDVAKFLPKLFKYKGVLNVGGPIQSVYNFTKKFNPKIKGINLKKNKHNLNFLNCSMNINKLKKLLK
ncbi:sugar nucleotide-binding protein [Candidatus Pelagibacter sp.]|jgi:dTDP-4-dehydrorhamnose reductase|nr:sugar nucleotide-binding protein [Candidatus Pelagibacter sp.]